MKKTAYIFDIDGTLADCTHRLDLILKKYESPLNNASDLDNVQPDWDAFHAACINDTPIVDVIRILSLIKEQKGLDILFVTGRPEISRTPTSMWLLEHVGIMVEKDKLFMRQDGDTRQDFRVKKEIYERFIKDNYVVLGVFEDRDQCVKMWRELGLTCFQVADGNY